MGLMVELNPVCDNDCQRLFDWRNDPSVDRWMSDPAPPERLFHNHWFEGLISEPNQKGWIIHFAGEPVGFLSLTGLTSSNRRAEWGWYVASKVARGRGVGRAAQALGLDIAFGIYGLERVSAEVLADNDAALRAQAAAGFRREGYLRHHLYKNEAFHDVVVLGILANEWQLKRNNVINGLVTSGLLRDSFS
jgi:UDP-4-amino-4,6-dideoxy-N-acetyl-beta-L-altrosamine N-acetyltransferase